MSSCEMCSRHHNRQSLKAKIQSAIDENGWMVIFVAGDEKSTSFAYTIGLTETLKQPELILVCNVGQATAYHILNEAAKAVKQDPTLYNAKTLPDIVKIIRDGALVEAPVSLSPLHSMARTELMCQAAARYGDSGFEAKQILLPDRAGLLPHEEGFDPEFGEAQPVLSNLEACEKIRDRTEEQSEHNDVSLIRSSAPRRGSVRRVK